MQYQSFEKCSEIVKDGVGENVDSESFYIWFWNADASIIFMYESSSRYLIIELRESI